MSWGFLVRAGNRTTDTLLLQVFVALRLFFVTFVFFPLGGGFTAISPRMASSKSASMIGGLGLVAEIIIITVSSSLLGVKRLQM